MASKSNKSGSTSASRRQFIKSAATIGSLTFVPEASISLTQQIPDAQSEPQNAVAREQMSIIGMYGSWAAGLQKDPALLSFRQQKFKNIDTWRETALSKARECVASPDTGSVPSVKLNKKYQFDGLQIEEVTWQLPYGRPTKAVILKPVDAKGKLPGIMALHDHGGNKYFGHRKITKTSSQQHPLIEAHQKTYYEGRAWANEMAKSGYVVLVHDAFDFASRRVLLENMTSIPWGPGQTTGLSDKNPEDRDNIEKYNLWAGGHEHVLSKSLFCAGTTWPGVFLAEDQRALDVLCARDDVDPDRVGCAGLSGGGLRTVFLGGLDPRIKCAVAVGFMTTWKDFILNKSFTHTWMTFVPLLPKYLDFPEILGLRMPLPTMVLNNHEDDLYTLSEMERANQILGSVFRKAGATDHYQCNFYPGEHKFDTKMQQDAFDWFGRSLKS